MKRWQFYLLSFTWGFPMTLIGCLVALALVCAGYKPKRFGWCWYFEIGESWGGLELGVFFLKCRSSGFNTKCHEHGHAFQNTLFGVFMPFVVCIPSAIRYWYRKVVRKLNPSKELPPYDAIWFEGQASRVGTEFIVTHGW